MAKGDRLTNAIGGAVADIRQKLIEEGWFGRTVTPRPRHEHPDQGQHQSLSEQFGWGRAGDMNVQARDVHVSIAQPASARADGDRRLLTEQFGWDKEAGQVERQKQQEIDPSPDHDLDR